MGRPERPLSTEDGSLVQFADDLREIRRTAGNPPFRRLATETGLAADTLSAATTGTRLPRLEVVEAYVRACGADAQEIAHWRGRWYRLHARLPTHARAPIEDAEFGGTGPARVAAPAPAASRHSATDRDTASWYRRWPILAGVTAVAAVVAASVLAALTLTPKLSGPGAGTGFGSTRGAGRDGGGPRQPAAAAVRDGFETGNGDWSVVYGRRVMRARSVAGLAQEGRRALRVTVRGPSDVRGRAAVATDSGIAGVRPGTRVTMWIWKNGRTRATVRPFATDSLDKPRFAQPESALSSAPGWSPFRWTVPDIDSVNAIGLQINNEANSQVTLALDAIAW